ncbi:MAG: HAMP domain-containing protein, partial [Oscillospiraceae bacterium]
ALILVLTCAAFLIVLQKLLSPLKKIKKAVSEIAKGKIGTTVSIRSNDELQDIAHSFTDMSQKLLEYFNNINVISKAYERYLPRDFFTLMDKRNVMEVNPEDRKKVTLTYLFVGMDTSSIHSKGTDGFSVINRIYGIVSSAVAANGGVVQALDDKCITCIFSRSAAAAVEAALTVQEKLTVEEFRQADIRISIQRAESTIGVIGTAEAMKTITVSSAISTQKYIAFFMKQFMLTAVTTGSAKENFGTLNVTTRYIGKFSSFYEKLSLENDEELYEMIDGCAPEDKQKKLASLASFNRGMDAIAAGNYKEGRKNMIDVLRINREDMIARHYLNVCEEGSSLFKEKKNESVFD